MEPHNPYAAPKAPLFTDEGATKFVATPADEIEYGKFWLRFAAMFIDGLILAPLSIALFVLLNYTRNAYFYYFLPSVVIYLFYDVWLVRRFGATPGKRILSMRIAMLDGSPVTGRAALLRYSPMLLMFIASNVAMLFATNSLGDVEFESLGYLEKMKTLQSTAPGWSKFVTFGMQAWFVVGAIVLVSNARKRAVHDFLARTMVVRTD